MRGHDRTDRTKSGPAIYAGNANLDVLWIFQASRAYCVGSKAQNAITRRSQPLRMVRGKVVGPWNRLQELP